MEQKRRTSLLIRAGVAYDTLERFPRYLLLCTPEVIQSSQIFQASTRLFQIWPNSILQESHPVVSLRVDSNSITTSRTMSANTF